jgi:hypothetical protein
MRAGGEVGLTEARLAWREGVTLGLTPRTMGARLALIVVVSPTL